MKPTPENQPIQVMRQKRLARHAPEMYDQLKRIQSWLFVDLLYPGRHLDRACAGKALAEINELLNNTVEKDQP